MPKKDSNVTYMKDRILSGVNIQMLKLAKEFLSKNEIMHLMDLSLKGMDDNTELLLYLSELFYELNEKEKSIELSKTINEKISVDPFILNDQDKNFRRIELCEFFFKIGDFENGNKIHDSIIDSFNLGSASAKSKFELEMNYWIFNKDYQEILKIISNKDFNQTSRDFTIPDIIETANHLFIIGEKLFLKKYYL